MSIDKTIEKEYQFYLSQPDEWKKVNYGKFVLIKDQNIIDTYSSYEDALKEGLKRFGDVPFLAHKIGEEDIIHYTTFGLMGIY